MTSLEANRFHLAQTNIAEVQFADLGHPALEDFFAAVEPVNSVAEAAPGFVWRLDIDYRDRAARPVIFGRDDYLFTLSVWDSLEALRRFTYEGQHLAVLAQRRKWFSRLRDRHIALWWIPAGAIPTVSEAEERLEHIRSNGPSPFAFDFRQPFPSPAEPTRTTHHTRAIPDTRNGRTQP